MNDKTKNNEEGVYKLYEEYIKDPHWNSGFWQTTIQFPGGSVEVNKRRCELTEKEIRGLIKNERAMKIYESSRTKIKSQILCQLMENLERKNFKITL